MEEKYHPHGATCYVHEFLARRLDHTWFPQVFSMIAQASAIGAPGADGVVQDPEESIKV